MFPRSAVRPLQLLIAGALLLGPAAVQAQEKPKIKKEHDVISREELETSAQKDQDLYSAIRSLRPHFLLPPRGVRTMAAAPPAPVAVYIDGNRQGDMGQLQLIQASLVQEVRYLDPPKAQDQFGMSVSGGAILVTMYKGIKPKPPT